MSGLWSIRPSYLLHSQHGSRFSFTSPFSRGPSTAAGQARGPKNVEKCKYFTLLSLLCAFQGPKNGSLIFSEFSLIFTFLTPRGGPQILYQEITMSIHTYNELREKDSNYICKNKSLQFNLIDIETSYILTLLHNMMSRQLTNTFVIFALFHR